MSEERSITTRLRANFGEFNANIDEAARKASKFGDDLEAASKKAEVARLRQRDAAQQVVAAENRLAQLYQSSKATSQQLDAAQRELTRSRNAARGATEAAAAAEKAHQQAAQKSSTVMGRLAQSADRNSHAWNTVSGVLIGAGAAVTALGAAALKTGIDYNGMQQQTRAALTTLLGSAEAANTQMDKLDAFARTSPFSKQVFLKAQQQMLAFGIEAKKAVPYLDAVQDAVAAAGGSGQTLGEIVYVMSQIRAAGKITAVDLLQFGQRGIDAATLIGSAMGMTGAEIRASITAGTLDASKALDALTHGMKDRFGGAAANVKNTWVGATDRIAAAWRDLASELAEPLIGKEGGGALVWLTNYGADLARTFERLPAPIKLGTVAIGGFAGVASLAAGSIMLLAPRLVQTKTAVAEMATAFPKLTAVMKWGKVAASGLGIALGVGVTALMLWQQASAQAEAETKELAETMEVVGGKVIFTANTFDELYKRISEAKVGLFGWGGDLVDQLNQVGLTVSDVRGVVLGDVDAIGKYEKAIESYYKVVSAGAGRGLAVNTKVLTGPAAEIDAFIGEQRLKLTDAQKRVLALSEAQDDGSDSAMEYAWQMKRVAGDAKAAEDRIKALTEAIWGQSDAARRQADADLDWHQTLADANQVLDENARAVERNGKALSLNTQAGRDNQRALNDIRDRGKARIDQLIEEQASTEDITAAMKDVRKEYVAAAEKAGYFGDAAKKAADDAGLIPRDVKIQIAALGAVDAEGALQDLEAQIFGLPNDVQTDIRAIFYSDGIEAAYEALRKVDKEKADAFIDSILDRGGIDEWMAWSPPVKVGVVKTKFAGEYSTSTGRKLKAYGGPIFGAGTETSDSIPAMLSNNEHVWSAAEVRGAGGHSRVERMRAMARAGMLPEFASGGAVDVDGWLHLASGGAARKKAAEQRKAREELLRQLRVDVRRGSIVEDVTGGSGLNVIDDLLTWARDANLSSSRRKELAAVAAKYEGRLTHLYDQLEAATEQLGELQQIYDQVYGSLNGFDVAGSLESTFTEHRDDFGNTWVTESKATASSIAAAAQGRAGQLKTFAGKLSDLQRAGASPAVLAEVAALGSEQGIWVADAFLADAGSLQAMNQAYSDISTFSAAAAQAVTAASYDGGLAAAKGLVDQLNADINGVGATLAEAFAKALGYKIVGDSLQKRALGGPMQAGVPYLVGEQGRPELIVPEVDSWALNQHQILNQLKIQSAAAPGVAQTHIHYHLGDVELRADALTPKQAEALETVAELSGSGRRLARAGV